MFERKNILVTGSAGFIGTNLCQRLVENGHNVIALDRVLSKFGQSLIHNIADPLPKMRVDQIYNLASSPSPAKYLKDPVDTSKTIILGAYNIAELARTYQTRILQTSTCEIYEEVSADNPRSCYRLGKKMAESIFYSYQNQYNIDIRIARLFNTYGPFMAMDDGRVIPVFIQKALKNEPIILLGNMHRSFCYITDIVEALIRLMNSDIKVPTNICDLETRSIKEIAEIIVQISNSKSDIILEEKRVDDFKQEVPKLNLAQNFLNWYPTVSFEKGIENTIHYFQEALNYVAEKN